MRIRYATSLFALAVSLPATAHAQVNVTINSSQNVKAISPYIYGSNDPLVTNRTFDRAGGNRWTAYNWETNASNAGSDWFFNNDGYLGGGNTPGGAVLPGIQSAGNNGRAYIQTIPMAGYVAADKLGGNQAGDVRNTPNHLQTRMKQIVNIKGSPFTFTPNTGDYNVYTDEFVNWIENYARVNPQQQIFYNLDNEPDLWSSTHNEVHASPTTYAELIQKTVNTASAIKSVAPNALVFGAVNYGWEGYRNLQGASGSGQPMEAPYQSIQLPNSPDNTIPGSQALNFQASFLKKIKEVEQAAGHKLVDVLDMHWYPEAMGNNAQGNPTRITNNDTSPGVVAARVQAARSLWDPIYGYHPSDPTLGENSWITQWTTGQQAIQLLNREQAIIDQYNPGTKIGITEYQFGAGAHISGGVAQADALGVFGAKGVFAANWWGDGTNGTFVNSAFNMYRNYDGQGGQFGDTSVNAALGNPSTDNAKMAAYASTDQDDAGKMVVVLINRTNSSLTANLDITNPAQLNHAEVYQLAGASATISHLSDIMLGTPNLLSYAMAPLSVTTLELTVLGDFDDNGIVDSHDIDVLWNVIRPELAGSDDPGGNDDEDLNADGFVNEDDVDYMLANLLTAGPNRQYGDADLDGGVGGLDYTAWRQRAGTGWANGDFDGDGGVGGLDYTLWRTRPTAYPTTVGPNSGLAAVPEPASWVLAALALAAIALRQKGCCPR